MVGIHPIMYINMHLIFDIGHRMQERPQLPHKPAKSIRESPNLQCRSQPTRQLQ